MLCVVFESAVEATSQLRTIQIRQTSQENGCQSKLNRRGREKEPIPFDRVKNKSMNSAEKDPTCSINQGAGLVLLDPSRVTAGADMIFNDLKWAMKKGPKSGLLPEPI